ncbi:MAG: hypothetical protein EOL88_08685 [Bacteroidia bacterium]|jgi:ankyrin repeat protein|nr:ankyrin repeat domain-containing protein [Bacteroidales bacterium]MDD2323739.1 hypothetical protein [Bacteroidales bacterium]MDD3010358.1 hypothetical protein [Bacteroidales bacterium]MDD3961690.1 hypothetical protein [Bacteroidales bacterium]NCD42153.1 hypothetical protein [Bacteroidia bacterium]
MKLRNLLLFAMVIFGLWSCNPTKVLNQNTVKDIVRQKVQEKTTETIAERAMSQEELIINAIKKHDLDALKKYLADVADVRTVVSDHVLLLHLAEEGAGNLCDKNQVTAYLIEKKASVFQVDDQGKAFHERIPDNLNECPRMDYTNEVLAMKNKIIKDIFEADSVEELKKYKGQLPYDDALLQLAAQYGARQIIDYLIAEGVSIRDGKILHTALNDYSYDTSFDPRNEFIRFLVEKGANVNAQNEKGEYFLIRLMNMVTGHLQMVEYMGDIEGLSIYLIEKGADRNGVLALAVQKNYPDLIRKLLAEGENLNDLALSETDLYNLSLEMAELFIVNGFEANRFIGRLSIIEDQQQQLGFLNYLLTQGVEVTEIDAMKLRNNFENVKYLISKGGRFSDPTFFLMGLVKTDCKTQDFDYMLENGAGLMVHDHPKNSAGYTLLHYVINLGKAETKYEFVQYFVEKGVDLNVRNKLNNETALDAALRKRLPDIADYLVSRGAKKGLEL